MTPVAFVVLVVCLVIGTAVVTTADENQVEIGIVGDDVLVRAKGAMAVWAFKNEVRVPMASITEVGVADRREPPGGLRAPGSEVPGLVRAGTHRGREGRTIWFVGRARRVVVIETDIKKPRRVVAQVADPEAVVLALRAALRTA